MTSVVCVYWATVIEVVCDTWAAIAIVTVFNASYFLFVLICLLLVLVLLYIQAFSATWANVAAVLFATLACSLTVFGAPAIFQFQFQHFISYTLFNCLSKQVLIFELVPF